MYRDKYSLDKLDINFDIRENDSMNDHAYRNGPSSESNKLLSAALALFQRDNAGHTAMFAYSRPYNADDPVRGAEDWPKFAGHSKYYPFWDEVALLKDSDTSDAISKLLPSDKKFSLIEPGPGPLDSVREKTANFIKSVLSVHGADSVVKYDSLDIDRNYGEGAVKEISALFNIKSHAVVEDFRSDNLTIQTEEGATPVAIIFGGTLFNLPTLKDAGPQQILQTYLGYMRNIVGSGGYVVITQDVNENEQSLLEAYDDEPGYGRKAAQSIMHRMERDLKTQNFSGNDFEIEVEWDPKLKCKSYVAVAKKNKNFGIGDATFQMRKNEKWSLVNAFKMSADTFQRCAEFSGFEHVGSVPEGKNGRIVAHVLKVK
jgi:uncharacterized SAM-dependent methyltransferase